MRYPFLAALFGSIALVSAAAVAQVPDQAVPLQPEEQPGIMPAPESFEDLGDEPDLTGEATQAQGAPTAAQFAAMAETSTRFEIHSSRLALERAQDDRIKQFAQRMIADHSQIGDRLEALVASQPAPGILDPNHARMLEQLEAASGNEFDRMYAQMQAQAHQEAVSLFETYARSGDNPRLREFAQQTLPILQDHLRSIRQVQGGS